MSLKREIAELEQVEEMQEDEELTEEMRQAEQRSIGEKVVGLYRRISIIVKYIDNQEATTIKEQQLREAEYREKAWELQAIELTQKIKDLTKLLKEKENEGKISGDNAFQEGVSYAMGVREELVGMVSQSVRPGEELKKEIKIKLDEGSYWITQGTEKIIDGELNGEEVVFIIEGR